MMIGYEKSIIFQMNNGYIFMNMTNVCFLISMVCVSFANTGICLSIWLKEYLK